MLEMPFAITPKQNHIRYNCSELPWFFSLSHNQTFINSLVAKENILLVDIKELSQKVLDFLHSFRRSPKHLFFMETSAVFLRPEKITEISLEFEQSIQFRDFVRSRKATMTKQNSQTLEEIFLNLNDFFFLKCGEIFLGGGKTI